MIGTEITITADLARAAGEIASTHPGTAITVRHDDNRPEHVWEVLASDGSEGDGTSYLVDDETGKVIADTTRAGRWQKLCAYYDVDLDDTGLNGVQYSAEIERYAAAAREYAGTSAEVTESGIATYPTEQEALEALGSAFIDGWAPDAVYDLDTGERIDLHVASPVVTRSEDQGTMENPLQPETTA